MVIPANSDAFIPNDIMSLLFWSVSIRDTLSTDKILFLFCFGFSSELYFSELYFFSADFYSADGTKAVKIKFDGLSKEVINWAPLNEGDLIFDIDLSGRKRMYVISDVVYASTTSIMVKIDGSEREERVSLKIPVAFSYAKFPIDKNGELKQVIDEKEINVASTFGI